MRRLFVVLFLLASISGACAAFNIFLVAGGTAGGDPTTNVLPSYNDVYANWSKAGLVTKGGIPSRTTNCANLSPSGPAFTLTTAHSGDTVVVFVGHNGGTVTGISSTHTTGWASRGTTGTVEEWTGTATSTLTAEPLTVTISGTAYQLSVMALAFTGTSGFDSHSGLPVQNASGSASTISTGATNTLIFGGYFNYGPAPTAGAGWTTVGSYNQMLVEYKIVSSAQSSLSVAKTGTTVGGIADALVQSGTIALDGYEIGTPGSSSDDSLMINNAIASCPSGQVVQLGAGTFTIAMANTIILNSGITVRGTGTCNQSSSPYCQTLITVPDGTVLTYADGGAQCGVDVSHIVGCGSNPVFSVGPSTARAWSGCAFSVTATGCSAALYADAAQGDTVIKLASQANLAVGGWVRIDEASGAVSQSDPANSGGTVFAASDLTSTSGSPATGKIAYLGSGVEDGAGYGALYDRETSEIHLITALGPGPCPGTSCTVTIDSPLTMSYRTSHSAQVYWPTDGSGNATPFIQQAGIENLSISRAAHSSIFTEFCAYCWIKNVEAYDWQGGIVFNNSARSEMIGSYSHDCTDCENNGAEYPVALDGATTETLISNNIIVLGGKGMVGRSCGGGNVVSYNYQDKTFYQAANYNPANNWIDMGVNGSHYVGCHHTLLEGNWGDNCDNDETHGNVVYHTFFRNWCTALRSDFNDPSFTTATSTTYNPSYALVSDVKGLGYVAGTYPSAPGPLRAGAMMRWDYWMAFVGNVLGESGATTTANGYVYNGCFGSTGCTGHTGQIWMLGWTGSECTVAGGAYCSDPNLDGTNTPRFLFRHGNYDFVNSSIADWTGSYSHTLPNSFYLSSTPDFFGPGASCSYTWPWVTPTGGSPLQNNSCTATATAGANGSTSSPTVTLSANCPAGAVGETLTDTAPAAPIKVGIIASCPTSGTTLTLTYNADYAVSTGNALAIAGSGLPAKARYDAGTPFVQP